MSFQTPESSTPDEDDQDLVRIFNTAILSSLPKSGDPSQEMALLIQSTEFKALIATAKRLGQIEGISFEQACHRLIATFRRLDEIWGSHLMDEGIKRLKGEPPST